MIGCLKRQIGRSSKGCDVEAQHTNLRLGAGRERPESPTAIESKKEATGKWRLVPYEDEDPKRAGSRKAKDLPEIEI